MHIAHRLVSTSCNVAGQYTPGETTGDLILTYVAKLSYINTCVTLVVGLRFRCVVLEVVLTKKEKEKKLLGSIPF